MKFLLALFLMLFGLTFSAFGQSNVEAIKSKTRVFVDKSSYTDWKIIKEALLKDKKLQVVENVEKAQFIVEHELQSGKIGKLTAFSFDAKKQKIIYWSETKPLDARNRFALADNQRALVASFLNAKNDK